MGQGKATDDLNWVAKYQKSNHHTDRVVRTKVGYENTTGIDFPEPIKPHTGSNMAWGKGGSTNVVQVLTRNNRRAISVPATSLAMEDVYYQPMASRTAQTVNYVKEDSNNLHAASRRQDERLMRDITARLANAPFAQPAPVKRESRSHSRRRAPSVPTSRRGSVSSTSNAGHVSRKHQSLADEDFEIVFPTELRATNLPPCARRAQNRDLYNRATSMPPTTPSREIRKRAAGDFIDTSSPLFRVVDIGGTSKPAYRSEYAKSVDRVLEPPPTRPLYVPLAKRRYSYAFEDPADFPRSYEYTPYARIASAYTPTMPYVPIRPYVRKYHALPATRSYGTEIEYQPAPIIRGYKAASEPRHHTPSNNLAIRQARASIGRIERELGMGSVSAGDIDPPYMDEPVITTTRIQPVKAGRTGFIRSSAPGRTNNYHYGVVSSRPPIAPLRPSTRAHEIEARLETMIIPDYEVAPATYSSLRSRTSNAKGKLDQHRCMLDRYLPCPMGPVNDVPYEVEFKYNELADRMPSLRPRDKGDYTRAASLPPYRPVSNTNRGGNIDLYKDAVRREPFQAKMSDTRKRAREVLCKTKRDPHYFDY